MTNFVDRVTLKIQEALNHKYSLYILGLAVFADTFIFFIPTDGLLIATIMAKPKRWIAPVLIVTIGSVLGSTIFAWALEHWGPGLLDSLAPGLEQSKSWIRADNFVDKYGSFAIFLMALSPISQQPVVALAALAQTPLLEIAAWLLGGRIIKYTILATAARKSPAFLMKLPFVKSEMSHVKIEKN